MDNSAPFEIISGPCEVYTATPAEDLAFPDVDENPGNDWKLLGSNGSRSTSEDGVSISIPQSVAFWRSLGSTGPIKAFRSSEDLIVSLQLADMTLAEFTKALENNAVDADEPGPGDPGTETIGMSRGLQVGVLALLVRFPSPAGDGMVAQLEVPRCVQVGEPELVFKKDTPVMTAYKFQALEDPEAGDASERFGRMVVQTDAAGT